MALPVAPVVLLTNVAVPAESWFPAQTHTSSMIPWIWAVLIISTPDHRLVLILPHAFWTQFNCCLLLFFLMTRASEFFHQVFKVGTGAWV